MAYSGVIQDSDDDGSASAVNSPLLAPIDASIQDGTTLTMPHSLQNGTGSTGNRYKHLSPPRSPIVTIYRLCPVPANLR